MLPISERIKRYGARRAGAVSLFLGLVVALAFLLNGSAASAGQSCSLEDLLKAALEKRLYQERYWHILLHYEKHRFGIKSIVDDPDFFLAPAGKTDPKAELEATIRYLFSPGADENATCRFYARFSWLKEMLADKYPGCFAGRTCPSIDEIRPRAASLVFPTYYMNNPASMFGHTLLLIDTAYSSKRLSNAVNFAAVTEGNDGLILAVAGLSGLYKGYYSVMPYYKKIQEYSDINQRDIWEYKLNLSEEELLRMVRHIRELDQVYTNYFFFDENCSYGILYLIEAARPSVRLTDRFRLSAIPVDTIKAVKEEGLITGVEYRPSRATRINYLIGAMDRREVKTALGVIEGDIDPETLPEKEFSAEKKIRVLDLAAEVIQYRFVARDIDLDSYRNQLLSSLKARSRLGRTEDDFAENIPVPPHPEQGHDSRRVSLGGGTRESDHFVEMRFRWALTDLEDMDYADKQGVQIEFGDLRGRYFPEDGRLALEQFDTIDIISLSPTDAFFKPLSWLANTGWHRKPFNLDHDILYYRLNGGAGYSARHPYLGLGYAMAEAELDISDDFKEDYSLGGGGRFGTILAAGRSCRIHFYGRMIRFFAGDPHTAITGGLAGNYRISTNNHLSVRLERDRPTTTAYGKHY